MGGSGVILLSKYLKFEIMYLLVAGVILSGDAACRHSLARTRNARTLAREEDWTSAFAAKCTTYAVSAYRAFCGSRAAMVGFLFVLLPAGGFFMSCRWEPT